MRHRTKSAKYAEAKMNIRTFAIAMVVPVLFTSNVEASNIMGIASKIVDGDTLYVCDDKICEKIRLCGIDAPELKAAGGKQARVALASIVTNRTVTSIRVSEGTVCDGRSKPTNRDRIVAQCFVEQADIAALMVERGQACDWVKFSGGHYSRRGQGAVCR
jgi:endonuclease YncB( thermonuclease family)